MKKNDAANGKLSFIWNSPANNACESRIHAEISVITLSAEALRNGRAYTDKYISHMTHLVHIFSNFNDKFILCLLKFNSWKSLSSVSNRKITNANFRIPVFPLTIDYKFCWKKN